MKKEKKNEAENTKISEDVIVEKLPDEEKESENEEALSDAELDKEAMEKDIELFKTLFPEITGKDIPDEVWQDVEKGIPLSHSFALYFVKEMRKKEEIEKVNRKNEISAPPKISNDGKGEEYFTPETVKGMTKEQVRKNYNAIIKSMEKWN